MLQPTPSDKELTLGLIEGSLTILSIALAFCWPKFGSGLFTRMERAFAKLAKRQSLAVCVVGCTGLLLRLAILPFCPAPLPFVPDDFSFLLAADTFAHGRLTNPTPPMWIHFESIHITMNPSYMSMYFPSNGLLLALGKVLFGMPWIGILIATALMSAAICWMLQAWLPPTWALFGGFLVVVRLGLFSYWVNTYSGGGCLCALGGALVLGSLPRLKKTGRARYGILMALGIVLLATTRPYEGMLLCLPVAAVLGHWVLKGSNRPAPGVLMRRAAFPLALIIAGGCWLGYYDYRAFGSPTTLPYTVNRAAYAVAPYYIWQSQRPMPVYRHDVLRRFYYENEVPAYKDVHKLSGFIPAVIIKVARSFLFFGGLALLPPLIMLRRVFLDRRIRFLLLSVGVLCVGMLIQIFLIPHYLAPFTAVFYAIGLQAMRHMRVWNPGGKPVGRAFLRLTAVSCLLMIGFRLYAGPLHLKMAEWPASEWSGTWYGPALYGTERAHLQSKLEQLDGQELVLVRYAVDHNPLDEWVYNNADIDGSKVIWAREMSDANNAELFRYYNHRHAWLVEPDTHPQDLIPYPAAPLNNAALR